MDEAQRSALTKMGWEIHRAVEAAYLAHPAGSSDGADWLEKQRLLLADMAIHLLQTAIRPGDIELDQLRNNLHAILTISDRFLPHAGLKQSRENLYSDAALPVPGE